MMIAFKATVLLYIIDGLFTLTPGGLERPTLFSAAGAYLKVEDFRLPVTL
jgi:hypothetical protein